MGVIKDHRRTKKRHPSNKTLPGIWVFVGYDEETLGYLFRNVDTGKTVTAHHFTSYESVFPYRGDKFSHDKSSSFREIKDAPMENQTDSGDESNISTADDNYSTGDDDYEAKVDDYSYVSYRTTQCR